MSSLPADAAHADVDEKKLRHREAQKRYLEKKKQAIGADEFRAQEQRKKTEYRARARRTEKALEIDEESPDRPTRRLPVDTEAVDWVTKALGDASQAAGRPLRPSSLVAYVTKLQRLSVLVRNKTIDRSWDWLKDYGAVVDALTKSGLKTLKDYLSPVCRLLPILFPKEDKLLERYRDKMGEWSDATMATRKQNVATDDEEKRYIPLGDAQRRIQEFEPVDDMDLVFQLICALYFMGGKDSLVPRNDLPSLRIVSSKKKQRDLKADYNYIVVDTANEMRPVGVLMQRYKSSEKWGKQKFGFSEYQRDILHKYIRAWKKQPGDFLFVNRRGEPFNPTTFRDVMRQATERVLKTNINVNLARKIVVSDFYAHGPHSVAEEESFHRRLLHTPEMGRTYMKLAFAKKRKAGDAASADADDSDAGL